MHDLHVGSNTPNGPVITVNFEVKKKTYFKKFNFQCYLFNFYIKKVKLKILFFGNSTLVTVWEDFAQ